MKGIVFCSKDIYDKINEGIEKDSFRMFYQEDYSIKFILAHYLPQNTLCSEDPLIVEVLEDIQEDIKEFINGDSTISNLSCRE